MSSEQYTLAVSTVVIKTQLLYSIMANPTHSEFSSYDHEMICKKIKELIDEHGVEIASIRGLKSIGLNALAQRIRSKTTWKQIKIDLGFPQSKTFSSLEEVKQHLKELIAMHGDNILNYTWLKENEPAVANYMSKHKSLIYQLREELITTPIKGVDRYPRGYFKDEETVLKELRDYIDKTGNTDFTTKELSVQRGYAFSKAITEYGGLRHLLRKLGIAIKKRGDDFKTIEQVDEEIKEYVKQYGESAFSTSKLLASKDHIYLLNAIQNFGGMILFRERLGLPGAYVKKGYWNDIENVLIEAQDFIDSVGEENFTQQELDSAGKKNLVHAIHKHGGMAEVRRRLGITRGKKLNGFWNKETVLEECRKLVKEYGAECLTRQWMDANNRSDLYNAIRMHTGKTHNKGSLYLVRLLLGINPDPYNQVALIKRRKYNLESLKSTIKNLIAEVENSDIYDFSRAQLEAIIVQAYGKSWQDIKKEEGGDVAKAILDNVDDQGWLLEFAQSDLDEPEMPTNVAANNITNALDELFVSTTDIEDSSDASTDLDEEELNPADFFQKLDVMDSKVVLQRLNLFQFRGDDFDVIQFLKVDAQRELWKKAYRSKQDMEEVIADCRSIDFKEPWKAEIKQEMLDAFEKIERFKLPPQYNFHVDGKYCLPRLMQVQVAVRAGEERRLLLMSDMGLGKSLAAELSLIANGCKNILVIGKNNCMNQWEAEFTNQWTGINVTRLTLDEFRSGNFNRCSQSSSEDEINVTIVPTHYFSLIENDSILVNLVESLNIDGFALDEIHDARQRDKTAASIRRLNLTKLMSLIYAQSPECISLGLSGTPVVNEYSEAISLLELITGEIRDDLKLGKPYEQGRKLHIALQLRGVRQESLEGTTGWTIKMPTINCQQYHDAALQILQSSRPTIHHELDKLLLPAKIRATVNAINGPTIIGVKYVEGVVDALEQAVKAAGYSVIVNTGSTNSLYRKDLTIDPFTGEQTEDEVSRVDAFVNGEFDVLIASIETISTGIDGLQNRCATMVIPSLPYSAADFSQLIKRLARPGQKANNVEIIIPVTEIEFFDTEANESRVACYEKYRYSMIQRKQRKMNAAMDGSHAEDLGTTQSEVLSALRELSRRVSKPDEVLRLQPRKLEVPIVFTSPELELAARKRIPHYGDFSGMNRRWNTTSSHTLHQELMDNPQEWEIYHTELSSARADWSIDPLQECITHLSQYSGLVIGDFGCGTAQLADALNGNHTVHSFDHLAYNSNVVACDIADGVPLETGTLDVAVFSLSLMGKNWSDQLIEARRCLKDIGQLIIWNASSSAATQGLQEALEQAGFKAFEVQERDKWTFIRAAAVLPAFAKR